MLTDPIADMLARIKNAEKAGYKKVEVPASGIKQQIARILTEEKFIRGYKLVALPNNKRVLKIYLRYGDDGAPVTKGMRRISKPGRRKYVNRDEIPVVRSGIGIAIISTSKGVLTDKQARMLGVGGELLCEVW